MPSPKQVERQHRDRDGGTREHHQPPRRHQAGVQRIGQHVAPGRRRWRDADAQEAERRLDDDGDAEMGGRQDQVGRHALRQDVAEHQALVRGADAARRLDVLHLLERQHDRADDASAERYSGDGDGHDHRRHAAAQRHGDRHRQYQVGKGLQELDDTLTRHVEASTEVAAGQAPQRADGRAEQHRAQRHGERALGAVDDAAQRVAADLVGAEPVRLARRLLHGAEVRLERRIGRDQRCRHRHGDDQGGDHAPEGRERGAAEQGADTAPDRPQDRGRRGRDRVDGRAHRRRILGSRKAMVRSTRIFSITNTTE